MSDNTPISQHDLDTIEQSIAKLAQTPAQFATINTFMKRRTHISQKAQNALLDKSSAILVNPSPLGRIGDVSTIDNLRTLFDRPDKHLVLEIGFGMGLSLFEMAKNTPDHNFVGIEVHEAGIGNLVHLAKNDNLNNLRVINGDAITLLNHLPNNHIDTIQLFFPDPWQKKRHYKRRFVTHNRMTQVARVLKTHGIFHSTTDWEHYALWMLNVLDSMPEFINTAGQGNYALRPSNRPLTKFEQRGLAKGHHVWDLLYQKQDIK